jgi:hypothetical protein
MIFGAERRLLFKTENLPELYKFSGFATSCCYHISLLFYTLLGFKTKKKNKKNKNHVLPSQARQFIPPANEDEFLINFGKGKQDIFFSLSLFVRSCCQSSSFQC